jgi:hypothetical protein
VGLSLAGCTLPEKLVAHLHPASGLALDDSRVRYGLLTNDVSQLPPEMAAEIVSLSSPVAESPEPDFPRSQSPRGEGPIAPRSSKAHPRPIPVPPEVPAPELAPADPFLVVENAPPTNPTAIVEAAPVVSDAPANQPSESADARMLFPRPMPPTDGAILIVESERPPAATPIPVRKLLSATPPLKLDPPPAPAEDAPKADEIPPDGMLMVEAMPHAHHQTHICGRPEKPMIQVAPPVTLYHVAAGDTAYSIAERFEVDLPTLLAANHIAADTSLQAAMALIIPADMAKAAVTPPRRHATGEITVAAPNSDPHPDLMPNPRNS